MVSNLCILGNLQIPTIQLTLDPIFYVEVLQNLQGHTKALNILCSENGESQILKMLEMCVPVFEIVG